MRPRTISPKTFKPLKLDFDADYSTSATGCLQFSLKPATTNSVLIARFSGQIGTVRLVGRRKQRPVPWRKGRLQILVKPDCLVSVAGIFADLDGDGVPGGAVKTFVIKIGPPTPLQPIQRRES